MNVWIHLGPIIGLAAMALLLTIERFGALFWVYSLRNPEDFFGRIRDLILAGKLERALDLCAERKHTPVSHVVSQALMKADQPEELVEHTLAIAVSRMTRKVQKRTNFIATIANVSTLLGLFGTILGLIQSFEAIGSASAQQRSALLTAGISTAMNATLLGLGVAIPCLICYSLLAGRTNRLVAEIEEAALRSMQILKEYYYSGESAGTVTKLKESA